MEEVHPLVGIWYEEKRNRWRVKLAANGELLCCKYYHSYPEAVVAWREVKQSIVRPKPDIPIPESSLINRFLCQPLVGTSRVHGH